MVDRSNIRAGMEVVTSDGHHFGTVDETTDAGIKLTKRDSPDGEHHYVDNGKIARVDDKVHLNVARGAMTGAGAGAAAAGGGLGKIVPWILLALGALILALWLAGSFDGRDDGSRGITDTGMFGSNETGAAAPPTGDMTAEVAGLGTLGTYLAGTDTAPRTFTFERLNFDTGQSAVRPADQAEVDSLAATLKQYGTSRVRVVGYADARGAEGANAQLGKARADAVKAALVAAGIDSGRIETASGGETDPVGPNETAGGRFDNRRTELVLTSR